jgi:hypothetical protein
VKYDQGRENPSPKASSISAHHTNTEPHSAKIENEIEKHRAVSNARYFGFPAGRYANGEAMPQALRSVQVPNAQLLTQLRHKLIFQQGFTS